MKNPKSVQSSNVRIKKNTNDKIGRPVIRDEELQFKRHFTKNQKRFEIEAQLLVYIYEIFRKQEIEVRSIQNRISQDILSKLYEQFHISWIYNLLFQNNKQYWQDKKCLEQHDKLNYTSIIDICYIFRLIKKFKQSNGITQAGFNVNEIFLIILFYLEQNFSSFSNEKLVNDTFLDYYIQNLINHNFEKILFNGPNPYDPLATISTLLAMFALQICQKEQILIQKPNTQIKLQVSFPVAEKLENIQGALTFQFPIFPNNSQKSQSQIQKSNQNNTYVKSQVQNLKNQSCQRLN